MHALLISFCSVARSRSRCVCTIVCISYFFWLTWQGQAQGNTIAIISSHSSRISFSSHHRRSSSLSSSSPSDLQFNKPVHIHYCCCRKFVVRDRVVRRIILLCKDGCSTGKARLSPFLHHVRAFSFSWTLLYNVYVIQELRQISVLFTSSYPYPFLFPSLPDWKLHNICMYITL